MCKLDTFINIVLWSIFVLIDGFTFQCLNWDLSPVTSNSWLNTFLQLIKHKPHEKSDEKFDDEDDSSYSFFYPQYSGLMFVQVSL